VTIGTNASLTNLSGIWYLTVPNASTNDALVGYSITADVLTVGPVTNSPLVLSAGISAATGAFSMSWNAVIGQNYQIQVSANLTQWAVATNILAQSTMATYTDAVPVNSQKTRFFRILTP